MAHSQANKPRRSLGKTWNRPEKQSAAVLSIVHETPSTSVEVAAELNIAVRVASAVLSTLFFDGVLSRRRMRHAVSTSGGNLWLYSAKRGDAPAARP